jgi:branched-chain amino acid aminotransferase
MNRGVQTFTSFLSDSTQFIFLDDHLERLLKGADYLFPKEKWLEKRNEIKQFLAAEILPNHYFRLAIIDDTMIFSKRAHAPKQPFVKLANAKSSKTNSIIPSFIKSSNYLLAELELNGASKRKYDDVVFFDQQNNLTEASTSNIFVLMNDGSVLTPKLSSMVLEGVTRKNLIIYLRKAGYSVLEVDISKSELESSSEIWLTNAIQGLRLVEQYETQEMFREKTIYQTVCHQFGRFGERFNHEKRN